MSRKLRWSPKIEELPSLCALNNWPGPCNSGSRDCIASTHSPDKELDPPIVDKRFARAPR